MTTASGIWISCWLGGMFGDVEELAAGCRFADCAHGSEPGCAVREAIDGGVLEERRWNSYLKMQREIAALARRSDVAAERVKVRPVAGLPLLHVDKPRSAAAVRSAKRAFDVIGSLAVLLALSPVFALAAIQIKRSDGGPVFFRQARVGRVGQPFGMVKFRSMVLDAEERLAELAALNESDGVLFKMKEDPRITRVGRFLRRYSIDELPQLVNVIRGEMSLVGPRPPLPAEVDKYAIDVHRRLLVRPGLTGLWQVSGRSGLSWDESVRLDLYYVENWSPSLDATILLRTLLAILRGSGAY